MPAAAADARTQRQRVAVRFAIALLFATAIIRTWQIATDWNFGDIEAYWQAALRLRAGEDLYLASIDPDSYRVFRYAPWFAWLWVPLTYLPRELVTAAWTLLLAGASAWLLLGLARLRSAAAWALILIMTPWLLSLVQVGNIQPLVVAALAHGIPRASGPFWIGVTTSLKVVPALFGLVYVARRQWVRLVLAAAVALLLAATYLTADLSGYETDPGRSYSLYYYVSPTAWVAAALASVALAAVLAWRQSRYVWVAAAVAVMLAAPRTHVTYATYLLVGVLGAAPDFERRARG